MRSIDARAASTAAGLTAGLAALGLASVFALRNNPELRKKAWELAGKTKKHAAEAGRRARTALEPVGEVVRDAAIMAAHAAGDQVKASGPEALETFMKAFTQAVLENGAQTVGEKLGARVGTGARRNTH